MIPYERLIHSYVHQGRIGVLVELAAETDFATRSAEFNAFAHDLALHIAASSPRAMAELLAQPFVKDSTIDIAQLRSQLAAKLREKVEVVRFIRWEVGESEADEPEPPKPPAVANRA